MFKHPTPLPISPSKILRAASFSENKNTVDRNTASSSYAETVLQRTPKLLPRTPKLLEGDARILDMFCNSDVGNPEVEGEALGYATCAVITKEAGRGDGASMFEPLAQPHSVEKHQEQSAKISGSATVTTRAQLQTPNAKSRKQEWKDTRASGLCSLSPDGLNPIESSNKTSGSSIPLSGEADVRQIMQDWMNQLITLVRGFADTLEPSTRPTHEFMRSVLNKLIKRFEVIADMFKYPTLPITPVKPSEILRAVSSSENKDTVDHDTAYSSYVHRMELLQGKPKLLEGDAGILHMLCNSDVGNPEAEGKALGYARCAVSSSENKDTVDHDTAYSAYVHRMELLQGKPKLLEGDAGILHMLCNSDVGNPEAEGKALGYARCAVSSSENKDTVDHDTAYSAYVHRMELLEGDARILHMLCNSDVGNPEAEGKALGYARCAVITKEDGHGDGASMFEPLAQPHSIEKHQELSAKISGSATVTSRKQERKDTQESGLSSLSSGVLNSIESNKTGGGSSPPSGEADVHQIMQDWMNQLITLVRGFADTLEPSTRPTHEFMRSVLNKLIKRFEVIADMFKYPTLPITPVKPSEILRAVSSSENKDTVDHDTAYSSYVHRMELLQGKPKLLEGDAGILHMLCNSDVGNPEAEGKALGYARCAVSSSENKDTVDHDTAYSAYVHRMELLQGKPKLLEGDAGILHMLCNSDVGNPEAEGKALGYARCAVSSSENKDTVDHDTAYSAYVHRMELLEGDARILHMLCNSDVGNPEAEGKALGYARCAVITKEDGHGDGASMFEPLAQPHSIEKHQELSAKISGSATVTSRKQERKDTQASGLSSLSSGVLNSIESNKTGGGSSPPSGEADVHQIMQDWMNQLITLVRGFADMLEPSTRPTHDFMRSVMNQLIKRFEVIADMFKYPTLPITPVKPSEILRAVSSSENKDTVDHNTSYSSYVHGMELLQGKPKLLEGDARILHMLCNSDVGNPEAEGKALGYARCAVSSSENKDTVDHDTAYSAYVHRMELLQGKPKLLEGDAGILHMLCNSDVGNPEAEGKALGYARCAVSSSENKDTVDHDTAYSAYVHRMELLQGKPKLLEGDARILHMLCNSDVGNPETEGKALGYERCAVSSSENKDTVDHDTAYSAYVHRMELLQGKPKLLEGDARILHMLCNSDVGNPEVEGKALGYARCAVITKEDGHGDGASMFEPLAQPHSIEKHQEQSAKISGSATVTSRKQERKDTQASGLSSLSSGVLNSIESNKTGGGSSPPSGEADVHQIMQDLMNQLITLVRGFADTLEPSTRPTHEFMRSVMNQLIKRFEVIADMFKYPTLPITPVKPSEILRAVSSSENKDTVDHDTAYSSYVHGMELLQGKPKLLEGDARILHMLCNSDVGNPEAEGKALGYARCAVSSSENKDTVDHDTAYSAYVHRMELLQANQTV